MHQIIDHTILHYIILSYFSFLSTLSFLSHNSLLLCVVSCLLLHIITAVCFRNCSTSYLILSGYNSFISSEIMISKGPGISQFTLLFLIFYNSLRLDQEG